MISARFVKLFWGCFLYCTFLSSYFSLSFLIIPLPSQSCSHLNYSFGKRQHPCNQHFYIWVKIYTVQCTNKYTRISCFNCMHDLTTPVMCWLLSLAEWLNPQSYSGHEAHDSICGIVVYPTETPVTILNWTLIINDYRRDKIDPVRLVMEVNFLFNAKFSNICNHCIL